MAKTSASETEVGRLHAKVVKIFGMTLDQMIEKLDNNEESEFAIDTRLLMIVVNFLDKNKIYSIPEEEVGESDLQKKIALIRSQNLRVVPLVQEG